MMSSARTYRTGAVRRHRSSLLPHLLGAGLLVLAALPALALGSAFVALGA